MNINASAAKSSDGFRKTISAFAATAVDIIDWIEAARDYVLLNTPTKTHIYRSKISELECRIDPHVIVRVHRSHMVSLKSVVGVERPGKGALRLLLSDGANAPVGPAFHEQVIAALKL